MKKHKKVECHKCSLPSECCRLGAWVDLGEAKKILALGIKGGDFFHLEKDGRYPSGYRVGTSVDDDPCSFMTRDGLCAIHKIDYNLKPRHCREFPYENGRMASIAKHLCLIVKARHKKKRRKSKSSKK